MPRALCLRAPCVAAWLAILVGCSPNNRDCTCAVMLNAERRTLACGETACIAGTSVSCIQKDESVTRGVCTPTLPTATVDAGSSDPPPGSEPDTRCDDLLTFCSVSCRAPASTAADCQATASTGNGATCESFRYTTGVACHP